MTIEYVGKIIFDLSQRIFNLNWYSSDNIFNLNKENKQIILSPKGNENYKQKLKWHRKMHATFGMKDL